MGLLHLKQQVLYTSNGTASPQAQVQYCTQAMGLLSPQAAGTVQKQPVLLLQAHRETLTIMSNRELQYMKNCSHDALCQELRFLIIDE
ncbi:hypothetical protein FKM82_009873 [Ascaphus truei]